MASPLDRLVIPGPELAPLRAALANGDLKTCAPRRQSMWRIASIEHGATSFDRRSQPKRFSPIFEADAIIPVMYLATTTTCALAEAVFRAPQPGYRRQVSRRDLLDRQLVRVEFANSLRLLQLHGVSVQHSLGEGIIDCLRGTLNYQATSAWAQEIYATLAECDGIEWRSRQKDSDLNWLVWKRPTRIFNLKFANSTPLLELEGLDFVRSIAAKWKVILDDDLEN